MSDTRILPLEEIALVPSGARVRMYNRRPLPVLDGLIWINLEELVSWSSHKDTVVVDVK